MNEWTAGDVSASQTLTDNDHLYPVLFNELRTTLDNYVYVSNYPGGDLGAKINAARADCGGTFDDRVIVLPRGNQTLSTSANFTGSERFTVLGQASWIKVEMDGGAAFDFIDSRRFRCFIGWINSEAGNATYPDVGILHSGGVTYNGDHAHFEITALTGCYNKCAFFTAGGEDFKMTNSLINNTNYKNQSGIYVLAMSASNKLGLSSAYGGDMDIDGSEMTTFQNVMITSQESANHYKMDSLIYLEGVIGPIYFNGGTWRGEGEDWVHVDLDSDYACNSLYFNNINTRIASGLGNIGWNFLVADDGSIGRHIYRIVIKDCSVTLKYGSGTAGHLVKSLGTTDLKELDIRNVKGVTSGISAVSDLDDSFIQNIRDTYDIDVTVAGNLTDCFVQGNNPTVTVTGTTTYLTRVTRSGYFREGAYLYGSIFGLYEISADPGDPAEGQAVAWQSDGTATGSDGDILMKVTAAGATKTYYLAKKTQPDYTTTNVTPDRAFDADTVAVAELADIVGTLIADLTAQGLLQ